MEKKNVIEFIAQDSLQLNNESLAAIVDFNVWEKHRDLIKNWIPERKIYVYTASEKTKNIQTIEKIYAFFQMQRINRGSIVIAIGGGIVMDIAGFCAATYMRGCRLWLIPTTFLGMIDAAIGGKNGFNFDEIKNNVGTFYQPERILIYLDFLKTLNFLELYNGWAECIKAALLKPDMLYNDIILSHKDVTQEIIEKAIKIKEEFVTGDLRDKGKRRFLNLGHTFAHVMETISDYRIAHGKAVAIGIRMAVEYSQKINILDDKTAERFIAPLDYFEFPENLSLTKFQFNDLLIEEILNFDKKAGVDGEDIQIKLVLFEGWGKPVIKDVPTADVVAFIKSFLFDYL